MSAGDMCVGGTHSTGGVSAADDVRVAWNEWRWWCV